MRYRLSAVGCTDQPDLISYAYRVNTLLHFLSSASISTGPLNIALLNELRMMIFISLRSSFGYSDVASFNIFNMSDAIFCGVMILMLAPLLGWL
jgi:hypothetical protein